jgi:DNA-binding NarL/FixJ family response regulator
MKRLRIIIADDHGFIRQGVRAVIESQRSWELCGEADNGRAAVELARKLKPEIAVLDITMPELNGLDVTRQIKIDSPKTKVLILTMHDSEALADEVLLAGARGYLLKSDAAELLPKAIETLVAGKNFLTPKIAGPGNGVRKPAAPGTAGEIVPRFRLTPRERQIVQLLAEGKTNKEVAYALEISLDTVETHRKNILNKLRLRSTADLVRYAIRNQLIQP